MAVPSTFWFDYEVTLSSDGHGSHSGVAQSLQALAGQPPGLAGSRPTIRTSGDRIRVESDGHDRPPSRWSLLFLFWSKSLLRRWDERNTRSARVRAFEIEVPGLSALVRDVAVLRMSRRIIAGPGTRYEDKLTIELRDKNHRLGAWSLDGPVREEPWS